MSRIIPSEYDAKFTLARPTVPLIYHIILGHLIVGYGNVFHICTFYL